MIAVFLGGTSSEREVSLGSGMACALALARSFPTCEFDISERALPSGFDPTVHVAFSMLHGTFGEDGGMQGLLDAAGAAYTGCDADSSRLTMDKTQTKKAAAAVGISVAEGIAFEAGAAPTAREVAARLGTSLVVKPNNEGSSVGLALVEDLSGLEAALGTAQRGQWLVERRILGRELSVGIIGGAAMGVVEIRPKKGVYDYASKYTKGLTEYLAPAPLGDGLTARVKSDAERAFAACGCRDFARVDFILSEDGVPFLLEINTLPGMKETSLLPMSARCAGLDFKALVREMALPAVGRFRAAAAAHRL